MGRIRPQARRNEQETQDETLTAFTSVITALAILATTLHAQKHNRKP